MFGRKANVVDQVVARGLCCGCGVCAGTVTCGRLRMSCTSDGEYVPQALDCSDCGACLAVCPFALPQTPLNQETPLGKVWATYVGHSLVDDERAKGSSGGLVTRLLKTLLERELVDGVVAIVPTGQPDRLFAPAILHTPEEIAMAGGSKYYPVQFSQILQRLHKEDGRYAFVGLPCVVTALRKAQARYAWVEQRLPYILGVTCGHQVSKQYTTLLAYLSGLGQQPLVNVEYRAKNGAKLADDYIFRATTEEGVTGRALRFAGDRVNQIWCNNLLTPDACFACVDLFAFQADATFMDAWLPTYVTDNLGTSLVIVRNQALDPILQAEHEQGRVKVAPISEAEIMASQAGALVRRRKAARVTAVYTAGAQHPVVRKSIRWLGSVPTRADLWHQRQRSRAVKWLLRGRGWRPRLGLRTVGVYLRLSRVVGALAWPYRKVRSLIGHGRKWRRRVATPVGKVMERGR